MGGELLVQAVQLGNAIFDTGAAPTAVLMGARTVQGLDEIRGFAINVGANPGDILVSQGHFPGLFDVVDTFPVAAGTSSKFIVPIVAKFVSVTFTSPLGSTVRGAVYLYPGK